MDERPVVNILTRTSGRPKYFKKCIQSVKDSKLKNENNKNTNNYRKQLHRNRI